MNSDVPSTSDDTPPTTADDGTPSSTPAVNDALNEPGDTHELRGLVRRRGLISGWVIAWPFLVLTLIACVIAGAFQWMQRPQLVPFTIGLYLCMAFFAHAYSIAWQAGKHVRQMLSMITVIGILVALVALHLDDGSARWVYRDGQRILRPNQPLLRLAVALDILAIFVILSHGIGLGFGHRFFHEESGTRVSRSMVRELLRDARDRFRGD